MVHLSGSGAALRAEAERGPAERVYKSDKQRAQANALEDHNVATTQNIWRILAVYILGDPEDHSVCEVLRLYCHHTDYNGTEVSAVVRYFHLKPFEDERNVTSLAPYPLRFAANSAQILDQAKMMGMKLLASIYYCCGVYSGWTLLHDPQGQPVPDSQGNPADAPKHINSEITVDFHEGFDGLGGSRQ